MVFRLIPIVKTSGVVKKTATKKATFLSITKTKSYCTKITTYNLKVGVFFNEKSASAFINVNAVKLEKTEVNTAIKNK